MELGGFESPTSWVRCKRSVPASDAGFRILERCTRRFPPAHQAGYAAIYTRICGDSGTGSVQCPSRARFGSNYLPRKLTGASTGAGGDIQSLAHGLWFLRAGGSDAVTDEALGHRVHMVEIEDALP
jgi:hypothetical protein